LSLLCRYRPTEVYVILRDLKSKDIVLSLQDLLSTTKQWNVTDATVWILEQSQAFTQAMHEIITVLDTCADGLIRQIQQHKTLEVTSKIVNPMPPSLLRIQAVIDIAVHLCDRTHAYFLRSNYHPNHSSSNECEQLYIMLLNSVVARHKAIYQAAQALPGTLDFKSSLLATVNDIFRSSIEMIFNSILHPQPTIVSMSRILVSIIGHPSTQTASGPILGDFRDVINGVIHTCHVESFWQLLVSNLQAHDLFQLVQDQYRTLSRGKRGFAPRCLLCRSKLIAMPPRHREGVNSIVMFSCGHLVHNQCYIQSKGLGDKICPKCKSFKPT